MSNKQTGPVYEFGAFRLDASERLLMRDGQPVALAPKVFDTLIALVENSGRLLDKDRLISTLWPDTYVEEATLARNISDLRKVLGESTGEQRFIETIPKRGYRFTAEVRPVGDEEPTFVMERHVRSRVVVEEDLGVERPDGHRVELMACSRTGDLALWEQTTQTVIVNRRRLQVGKVGLPPPRRLRSNRLQDGAAKASPLPDL